MKLAGCGAMLAVAVLAEGILGSICHAQAAKGEFPDCRAIHIDSPDRHWALASTCSLICPENMTQEPSVVAVCSNNQNNLFIEDAFTHHRQPIAFYGFAGSAVWSPNSKAIFVKDHMGSNITEASLYTVDPLKKIDVAQAILRADRSATRYAHGHSYYVAREWLDNQTVLVQFWIGWERSAEIA